MKKNWLLIVVIAVLLVAVGVLMVNSKGTDQTQSTATGSTPPVDPPGHSHGSEANASAAQTVPAFFEVAPSKSSLGPTLEPEKFTGLTRDAYRAAREIPVTLAQLPCYCYCDKGFGHKSLYSCFEDDHASHCDVCTREALLALKLEREQKLKPAQIREIIMAKYSH